MTLRRSLAALALGLSCSLTAPAAEKLPSFNVDATQTSVSGLSSGAFMAVQMQVAHSASIVGAGVVAGGPYYCAAGNMAYTGICMGQIAILPPNPALMVGAARGFANTRQIDALSNLKKRRVYVFSGTRDSVVRPAAVDATTEFFRQIGVPAANLLYVNQVPAGHALITPSYGNACDANAAPYISHCDYEGQPYDQAGELMRHIHGPLQPKATALAGRLVTFDQRPFASASTSLAEEGFLYVPPACAEGQSCRIHVALHGCVQSAESVGKQFIADTGYNEWAENNHFLVLYPQVNKSSLAPFNPQGCWDWWGYTGSNYATRAGAQVRALKAMIDALGTKK